MKNLSAESLPKIGIIGTGAMASLMATMLQPVAEVVLIGVWQAQIDALRANGLIRIANDMTETHFPIQAMRADQFVDKVDVAIVLTKSYQTEEAIQRTQQVLSADGIVLLLQNGVGHVERFQRAFPQRVTVGTISYGATMVRAGVVRFAGAGKVSVANSPPSLLALLRKAMVTVEQVDSAESLLWGKVAINAGINPLTAIWRIPNGVLAEDETLRALMQAAAREAEAVAHAQQIALPYLSAEEEVVRVARATAANRSSMWQDVGRGVRTEIEAICGQVVKFGRVHTILTPINQALLLAILTIEAGLPFDRRSLLA